MGRVSAVSPSGKKATCSLRSKSGKPLERYFPDIVAVLTGLKARRFVLDGELMVKTEHGFSFSELQLRLHPAASRVQKLAAAHPASYVLFDLLLGEDGIPLIDEPLSLRRRKLETFYETFAAGNAQLALSPQTASLDTAHGWVAATAGIDGLIAKNADDTYHSGERRMQKYKFIRTADCVVGGFRYGTGSKLVGSLLLGLYDDAGRLNHVGFTSAIAAAEKAALTQRLEKLAGEPGFTGNAPGAPSRWSSERSAEWVPLRPKLVAEVSYDHASDGRFRHGTRFLRWRPDKDPRQCRMEQLAQKPA
jgi:ATP-dependent DNA ligase